ncbi:MAG: septum site-determining protein MinD [Firmicutes bacterium]|nr:septum site-determining protein MinD [Bacillota bacterium]MBR0516535.1 septum site-determining protein MinD [Bacillota bacterium]
MGITALVTSGKGGAGKTTITVNLGATLAQKGARVVLVDFNMGLRNLDIYLGMEDCSLFDLGDVLTGVCKVEKALVHDERFGRLYMLPCPQFKEINGITAQHVAGLFGVLKNKFDYVLVDMPLGVGQMMENAASAADLGIVVVTPDYVSLRNADTVDRKLDVCGLQKRCFIINQVDLEILRSGNVPGIEHIARNMSTPLAGIIPYDENIHAGNNMGSPVVLAADSYIAKNFSSIALRVF